MSHQAAVPQKRLTPDESYDVWKHLSKDARCIIDTDCGLCFDSRCTSSNDFCANSEFDGNDLAPLLAMTDFNHSHWDILQHTHTSHKIVILAVAINTKAATKWRDYYKASMNGEKPETVQLKWSMRSGVWKYGSLYSRKHEWTPSEADLFLRSSFRERQETCSMISGWIWANNDEEIGHSLFTYTRENQRCNPERRNTKVSAVLEGDHTSVRAQLCAKFQCMEQHKLPESGKCPCHNHLVLVWQSFLVTDETKRRKRYERTLLAVNSGDLKHPENSQRPQLGINRLEKMMNGKKQRTGPQRSHTLCCLANNTGRVKACDKASTLHDVLVERMNNPKLPKVKCGEVFENERRAENEELKQQGIEELELEQEHLELERKELKEKQPEGAANRMSWEWEGDDNERDDD